MSTQRLHHPNPQAPARERHLAVHRPDLPVGTTVELPLHDDERRERNDKALGVVNRLIWWALLVLGLVLLIACVFPSNATLTQRAALLGGALLMGLAAALLHRSLHATLEWAKAAQTGSIFVGRNGMVVRHGAVLDGDLRLSWNSIQAIALDSGSNHDERGRQRRFRLPPSDNKGAFLFDTGGDARSSLALISDRPVAPNMAVLFNRPITLHNSHHELTDVAFLPHVGKGLPARPPLDATTVTGILLYVDDLPRARQAMLHARKVRALAPADFVELEDFDGLEPLIDLR